MTRILYWNLNKFSLTKISAVGATAAPKARNRRYHIVHEVFAPNVPHIFVVVEAYGGIAEVGHWGTLTGINVRAGVLELLEDIRNVTGNPDWCAIPTICTGSTGFRESVAVFFDSTNLRFDGPYVWGPDYRTATRSPPLERACPVDDTERPDGANPAWKQGPQEYPSVWDTLRNRDTDIDDPITGGQVPEDRAAAQWEFFDRDGSALTFPTSWNRAPYLVEFAEYPNAHNERKIKIFAIHTSPATAAGAVEQIGSIDGLEPKGDNGITVVLGDFNVDTITSIDTYGRLEGAGFAMHIDPRDRGTVVEESRSFCQTHLLPTDKATPFNETGRAIVDPTHNPYPAYGYMGSMGGFLFRSTVYPGAIDNVFTWYGAAAAAPAVPNTTIVNTIVGSPYDPVPAAVPQRLSGDLPYDSALNDELPDDGVEDNPPGSNPDLNRFRQWGNFGVIRDASDHLPLIVDV